MTEKIIKSKKRYLKRLVAILVLASLLFSVIYSLFKFLNAPTGKPRSDYLLMLVQCTVGLTVMGIPSIISRKYKVKIPSAISIFFYLFLFCAIFLGEVLNFYYVVPHWDTILHAISGGVLGALGFVLVDFLNRDSSVKVSLSPFFISLFAFCFALSVGALWEIYEFSFDSLLGLNMQKARTASGLELHGREALADTMKDLIIDAAAALLISGAGYVLNRRKQTK